MNLDFIKFLYSTTMKINFIYILCGVALVLRCMNDYRVR
jgi:hypothetical protein